MADPGPGSGSGPPGAGSPAAAQVFVADLAEPEPDAQDAHHLGRVLRLRDGEAVVACDGRGSWRLCRYRAGAVPSAGRRTPLDGQVGWLEVDGPIVSEPVPTEPVTVGFVPVKGDRPEWVVQKLTELGVDRIAVLRSERSVVRWGGDRAARALDRLRRVAREAAAQSRRARLPVLDGVWSLTELSAAVTPQAVALADPEGAPPDSGVRSLAVGPEGGWDRAERDGFPLVSLGRGVLRAETAALAGATVLCAFRDGMVGVPGTGILGGRS